MQNNSEKNNSGKNNSGIPGPVFLELYTIQIFHRILDCIAMTSSKLILKSLKSMFAILGVDFLFISQPSNKIPKPKSYLKPEWKVCSIERLDN